MSESVVEKIKQVFGDFDVVAFLEQHNVKYDEWLKSQIFQLLEAVENDVLKILKDEKLAIVEMSEFLTELKEQGFVVEEKQKLQEFCKDVLQVMAGISWFNVDDEEARVWKFIEEYFPDLGCGGIHKGRR